MKYSLAIFLLLVAAVAARAQKSSIDLALDSYASICDECIALKAKALSGEKVSSDAFSTLLGRLASLRATLSKSYAKMTPSQRLRLQSIRTRYEEAFPISTQTSVRQALPRVDFPTDQILPSEALSLTSSSILPATHCEKAVKRVTAPKGLAFMALGGFPAGYFGLMGLFGPGRFGGYVKATALPDFTAGEYSCLSNGTTPSGGYIWTTGREKMTGYSLSAGSKVRIAGPASVYAGLGYGKRTILWEDTAAQWARVADKSHSGITADAGLILSFGKFHLMAGGSTISFKAPSAEIGIGFEL